MTPKFIRLDRGQLVFDEAAHLCSFEPISATAAATAASSAAAATTATAATAATSASFFSSALAATKTAFLAAQPYLQGLGAVASIAGGIQGYQGQRAAAEYSKVQADQELLMGLQQENEIRKRTIDRIAFNNARAGASGIDLGSGVTQQLNTDLQSESDYELSVARDNAWARAMQMTQQGRAYRRNAWSSLTSGFGQAAAIGSRSIV
jgi:hypothetical protein